MTQVINLSDLSYFFFSGGFPLIHLGHWGIENSSESFISKIPLDPLGIMTDKFITTGDLESLKVEYQLKDSIVNGLLALIKKLPQATGLLILSTYFTAKVFNFKEDTSGKIQWNDDCQPLQNFTNLESYDRICIPVLNMRHYTFYLIDIEARTISYYNSTGSATEDEFKAIGELFNVWASQVRRNLISNFTFINQVSPVQIYLNDCGVHLILNILHCIYYPKIPITYTYQSKVVRQNFRKWLIEGKISEKFVQTLFSK